MPEPESIEVVPSEESGNVPAEAPNEQTPPAPTPGEENNGEGTPAPEPAAEVLYDLPDGRKVNAEQLSKEWKENFLPDYTRKSQELARKSEPAPTTTNPEPPKNPYADPDYVPQTYEEIIKAAEDRAIERMTRERSEEAARIQEIEDGIATQLSEIKALDPNLNENELFLHANKFGFRDLKLAYDNMKYINDTVKTVQQKTAQNVAKRNDPVSTTKPGQTTGTPLNPSNFSNARDYLRGLIKS